MPIGWDAVHESFEKASTEARDDINLKSGDKCTVVFLGEPVSCKYAYVQEAEKKYQLFDPKKHKGIYPGLRFYVNVLDMDSRRVKVMVGGTKLEKAIDYLRRKHGDAFQKTIFEIERIGDGSDTTFPASKEGMLEADPTDELWDLRAFSTKDLGGNISEIDPDDLPF